ncbi:Hypothetical predicted protein [Podarcis lilfordi]|uniref:Uncharacterized protein n=1 Tax=Podarcis lilfordi TaxID=74358 RepID=A0AA35JUZ7_9SAUR|nr:Hypothetical predicted protein [Podarcis lilfordi]
MSEDATALKIRCSTTSEEQLVISTDSVTFGMVVETVQEGNTAPLSVKEQAPSI